MCLHVRVWFSDNNEDNKLVHSPGLNLKKAKALAEQTLKQGPDKPKDKP